MINIIIIAKYSILINGKLSITIEELNASEVSIKVAAKGKKIKQPEDHIILIADDLDSITLNTKNIQIYYTRRLADLLGATLSITSEEQCFNIETIHRKISG